jgi:hypothetical protein
MTPEEMQELRDAVAAYAQQDVRGGRLLGVLVERFVALDARVQALEQAATTVVEAPVVAKNEKGG